jgi:hypothetical protein
VSDSPGLEPDVAGAPAELVVPRDEEGTCVRVELHKFTMGMEGQAVSYSHSTLRQLRQAAEGRPPAVYIMRDAASILYVGESPNGVVRPMTGLKIGYAQRAAYPWRRDADLRGCRIECLVLSLAVSFADSRLRRALEAEVAVTIRLRTGAWPRKMTEIHFSESLRHYPAVEATHHAIVQELANREWIPACHSRHAEQGAAAGGRREPGVQ